jgi:rare lipoprotein A
MRSLFPKSPAARTRGSSLGRRVNAFILMSTFLSATQGCSIISNAPQQSTSTSALLLPEHRRANPPIARPQTDSSPPEIPSTAVTPYFPETQEAPPPAKLPAPSQPTIAETGLASWYGRGFHRKLTASGEVFDQDKFTAAHRTLPWGSRVKVTNLGNGKSVEVRINDRGPFGKGRVIDLSRAAARVLDMVGSGVTRVRIEWLSPVEISSDLVLQDK